MSRKDFRVSWAGYARLSEETLVTIGHARDTFRPEEIPPRMLISMPTAARRWQLCSALIIAGMVVVSLAVRNRQVAVASSDIACLAGLLIATAVMIWNARSTHGRERAFWSFYALGCAMWAINQAGWTYYEVISRQTLPDPFVGDVILFLHVVPFMAALAIRPYRNPDHRELDFSTMDFAMLLIWWVFLYTFVVVPDEYVHLNSAIYSLNYDRLYVAQSAVFLVTIGVSALRISGYWRRIYGHMFLAGVLYTASSLAINTGIRLGRYYSGSLYDVPFLASILWVIWAGLMRQASQESGELQVGRSRWLAWSQRLAMAAIVSLPLLAFWAVFTDRSPHETKTFRLLLCLGTTLVLGGCVFARQFVMDRELVRLLKTSRESFENLERLQSHLVQKEKLASLGQVVAGAAHDINSPLSSIVESCGSLTTDGNLNATQHSTAEKIGQQARRTQSLVSNLLSFAQQAPSEKAAVEIGSLLQRVIQMALLRLESKNIRVALRVEPEIPSIIGNTNLLFQSFLHILENAEDALEEVGGGDVLITARCEQDELVLQFADSGRGIRQPQRVFDPFYTTKPIGKGTGLGLSATYGVIQDHGGQINCYNRAEGGAMFVVRLPIATEVAEAAKA